MTGVGSFLYNAIFAAHIAAVVAAFGPTLAYAAIQRAVPPKDAGKVLRPIHTRLSFPALGVALITGAALVGVSGGGWKFSDSWISSAFTTVLVLLIISFLLGRTFSESSDVEGMRRKSAILTGLLHTGLLVMLVLMIWKPGA